MGSAVFSGTQNHFLSLDMYQMSWVINVIIAAHSVYGDRESITLLHMLKSFLLKTFKNER